MSAEQSSCNIDFYDEEPKILVVWPFANGPGWLHLLPVACLSFDDTIGAKYQTQINRWKVCLTLLLKANVSPSKPPLLNSLKGPGSMGPLPLCLASCSPVLSWRLAASDTVSPSWRVSSFPECLLGSSPTDLPWPSSLPVEPLPCSRILRTFWPEFIYEVNYSRFLTSDVWSVAEAILIPQYLNEAFDFLPLATKVVSIKCEPTVQE